VQETVVRRHVPVQPVACYTATIVPMALVVFWFIYQFVQTAELWTVNRMEQTNNVLKDHCKGKTLYITCSDTYKHF
jgi:hypothetical protein